MMFIHIDKQFIQLPEQNEKIAPYVNNSQNY